MVGLLRLDTSPMVGLSWFRSISSGPQPAAVHGSSAQTPQVNTSENMQMEILIFISKGRQGGIFVRNQFTKLSPISSTIIVKLLF